MCEANCLLDWSTVVDGLRELLFPPGEPFSLEQVEALPKKTDGDIADE